MSLTDVVVGEMVPPMTNLGGLTHGLDFPRSTAGLGFRPQQALFSTGLYFTGLRR